MQEWKCDVKLFRTGNTKLRHLEISFKSMISAYSAFIFDNIYLLSLSCFWKTKQMKFSILFLRHLHIACLALFSSPQAAAATTTILKHFNAPLLPTLSQISNVIVPSRSVVRRFSVYSRLWKWEINFVIFFSLRGSISEYISEYVNRSNCVVYVNMKCGKFAYIHEK